MKIGAQMYTVRDYLKTPENIEASLRRIKAIGFNMIQISGFGPCDVDLLSGWLRELDIEAYGTHSPWERMADPAELKKLIDEHKKLGCSQIGIGAKPDIYPNTGEGYTRFIKKANEICKQVRDAGLSFGYHNHDFEFEKLNGTRAIDRLIEECPEADFIIDVFWVQAGGGNPSAYIDKLKGRIPLIHFKDYRIAGRSRQFAEIGEGNLDWNDIVSRCEKNGIPNAVIEQDADFLIDPFDSLARSREFLVTSFPSLA